MKARDRARRLGGARRADAWKDCLRLCAASAVLVVVALTASCMVPAPETEGGELYRHNWWNFYTRGCYFLKQNRIREAMADFQCSLGVTPGAKFGNTHDMWRARTYGLHFVEGYFPNRELGVCLYELKDYGQAARYLETSLKQEPSGRAKHYLNLAYQKDLAGRAVPAPLLRLDDAAAPLVTRTHSLTITGAAEGEGRIARLEVAGKSEFIELAQPRQMFSRRVPLVAGTNLVTVSAVDLTGQRVSRRVVRIADWQPPRLTVRRSQVRGRERTVEAVCRDEFGLAEVALGGQILFRAKDGETVNDLPVSLRVPDEGTTLALVDRAGNRLECVLSAQTLAPDAEADSALPTAGAPAFARAYGLASVSFGPWTDMARLAGGAGAASPLMRGAPVAPQKPAPVADRLRPALRLKGCQRMTKVFAEDFFVDGTASDGGGLASVSINGEELLAAEDSGSARAYFSRRLPLDIGTNCFEIAAVDRAGNRTTQEIAVVRIKPEYLDECYRLSVGVPPLDASAGGGFGVRVKRIMESELTRAPVRFRLLERDEGWDFVLREQGLSVSDLADPSAALRIGKMVPAELLLMGKLFAEAKGITIYVRAVETGRGEVVFASDVYSAAPDRDLDDVVAGLVRKVEQGFPLVTGEILKCEGAKVTLSVGREDGVNENSRFLVVDAGNGDLAAGRVCQASGQAVQARIERLQAKTSTARILSEAAGPVVKEGYYVYTK